MKGLSLLYENSEILLVNKAAGISVQGGTGVSHPLDEELARLVGYKVHLVHRLDKDTAGLLVVAKSSAAAARWMRAISDGEVAKEYAAVCVGVPASEGVERPEGVLESPVEAHGRLLAAVSRYRLVRRGLAVLPGGGPEVGAASGSGIPLSLLSIRIETGRMHQIRIQTAAAGFPVAADDRHGDFRANRLLRRVGIRRLQLAATRLTLPLEEGVRTFEVPLPPHMQAAIDAFF